MPNSCAVLTCKNVSQRGGKLSFFHFPKDENVCESWVLMCGGGKCIDTSTARVCSEHFLATDFASGKEGSRLRLKKAAAPSIKLGQRTVLKRCWEGEDKNSHQMQDGIRAKRQKVHEGVSVGCQTWPENPSIMPN